MLKRLAWLVVGVAFVVGAAVSYGDTMAASSPDEGGIWITETAKQRDARMEWWREARFGMFIHWGLYAVPAGEWGGKTTHAEWIKRTGKIPVETYDKFVDQFNPVKFDADAWVKMAKRAGMKYIVITSKHHDGFCLWPSEVSEYDIESTPYKKDLLGPLTEACEKHDVRMCFYHSVMDWRHPHYTPKHSWDPGTNPKEGEPDYDKYLTYMKAQLAELVEDYDPGVMWFDGEWEGTFTHEHGKDLYEYVRGLKPDIIINNRVDKGRHGMAGTSKGSKYRGDFCTPEQQIPATGLPGVDWESCMTMNSKWGWNKADTKWKSTEDLIQKLTDIASKGGNFLLNIGPKADGTFPDKAIERLEAIGQWMDVNSESIYGTSASPFEAMPWGRCTMKKTGWGNTRLYLHVFKWPESGKLSLPIRNRVKQLSLLADQNAELTAENGEFKLTISLPETAPDSANSVIALDIKGDLEIVSVDPYANETKAERDARMEWWRESKFGMFIHWGVYAVPAGTYNGEQIKGIGEWIMLRGKIPVDEYKAYAKDFNPVKYDADEWVRLAKEAGMKYIVITAKHHDGFALFDSKVTDWDIADATPYKKDLLEPMVAAAKKHGLKIGFYYSQAQDWTHPGGAKAGYSEGDGWDETHKGDFDKYLQDIAYPQVNEIMSNYDIDVLWWDTPKWMNAERAELLLPSLYKRPGIIHNNRLGGGYRGDTDTPEQHIPATGIKGRDWETCMTMNGTWGYKSYDHNWKSVKALIQNLCDIVSKGGNYLLNVGPKADGTIPDESIERLKTVGEWMKTNGEAIYGTSASPCKRPSWGRITRKVGGVTTTLYLHVFDWPADGKLNLWVGGKAESASLLGAPDRAISATSSEEATEVTLSGDAPDPNCSVIKLVYRGPITVTDAVIRAGKGGAYQLAAADAVLHGGLKMETKAHKPNIGFWLKTSDHAEWTVHVDKPGAFEVSAEIAAAKGGQGLRVTLQQGKGKPMKALQATLKGTGSWEKFETVNLGRLTFKNAGKTTVALRAEAENWQPPNVRQLTLVPVK